MNSISFPLGALIEVQATSCSVQAFKDCLRVNEFEELFRQ